MCIFLYTIIAKRKSESVIAVSFEKEKRIEKSTTDEVNNVV